MLWLRLAQGQAAAQIRDLPLPRGRGLGLTYLVEQLLLELVTVPVLRWKTQEEAKVEFQTYRECPVWAQRSGVYLGGGAAERSRLAI